MSSSQLNKSQATLKSSLTYRTQLSTSTITLTKQKNLNTSYTQLAQKKRQHNNNNTAMSAAGFDSTRPSYRTNMATTRDKTVYLNKTCMLLGVVD